MEQQPFKIADAGGDTLTFYKAHNGESVNWFFRDINFDVIRSLPLRDDDIMICSYPRSGVHWLWEQTRILLAGKTDIEADTEKEASMLEFHFSGKLDAFPSPRILNSHYRLHLLPTDLLKKRTKVILLTRNPKDVAVSYYNFQRSLYVYEYNGQFGNYLKLFQEGTLDWGSYSEFLKSWEKVITEHPELPVHLVSYENLRQHPVEELSRLSEFLGKKYDPEFLQEVAETCTINKQRARKHDFWKDFDPSRKLENVLYRKGGTGGWKEWFTVAQSEQFDAYWAKAMQGCKMFHFTY